MILKSIFCVAMFVMWSVLFAVGMFFWRGNELEGEPVDGFDYLFEEE